ncbi:hypothetical protein BGW41_004000 [Actinomortierella wolfii]|nr:hypothetical protein BGW41_004000 [Actinomortierella wolfii]
MDVAKLVERGLPDQTSSSSQPHAASESNITATPPPSLPPPPPRIWLPAEILFHVAEYLDRQSLSRASCVCRFWKDCLEPFLWTDIPSSALRNQSFQERLWERQHYVQRLSVQSYQHSNKRATAGDGRCVAFNVGPESEKLKWSSDMARNRLLSLRISFKPTHSSTRSTTTTSSSAHHHSLLLTTTPSKCPESRLLDLNHSTLRELYLIQWPLSLYGDILHSILALSNLRRLKLEDWSHVNGRAIRLILESCPQLESLLLPMNTMTPEVTTFWELRSTVSTWKFEAEPQSEWPSTATNHYVGSTSTASLLQQITQQQPLRTKIEELILDRSAISMDLVLNLAHVCRELKVLSLEETYGLGFVEASSGSSTNDGDDSSQASESSLSDGEDDIDVESLQGFNEVASGLHTDDQEMEDYTEYQVDGAEEISDGHLSFVSPNGAISSDSHQISSLNTTDTHLLQSGGLHIGQEATGMSGPSEAHGETQESTLISFLDSLYDACPKIHSFNFNECSSDGLDDYFMTSLVMLWGPNDLRSLKARNVGIGSRMFLRTLSRSCGSTLTCLDLSMDLPAAGGAGQPTPSMGLLGGQSNVQTIESKRIPETMVLFQEFPALTFLDIRGVAIKTSWVNTAPWSCTRLKTLRISVESSGRDHDRRMYEQLGRLTSLHELVLTRIVRMTTLDSALTQLQMTHSVSDASKTNVCERYPNLDLSIDAGLGQLEHLVLLKKLDIRDLGRHCLMNQHEREWLSRNWPNLQIIEGMQDLSKTEASEIQEELLRLTRFQTQRPFVRVDWEHGRSRRQIRWLERTMHGHDAKVERNSHDDSIEQPDRPGGRCSRELMYESLRPRGGRSPSPLRTWY